ncbi:Troponin, partial [Trichinella nativa]
MFDEDVNSNRKYYKREEEEEDLAYVEIPDRHYRYGGAQVEDDEEEDARRKREERERKKAEVRKRLEEAGRAKKAKKGFLTPERKKKLRQLLMKKAAEDLKQQQLLKEQERQRILQERIIPLPDVDSINNQSELEKIASQFVKRIAELEELKYDLEYSVRQKDFEINELTIQVNDLRGKFVKPTLKKVSKYDNKFKKFAAKKEEKVDFRANLKIVKKDVTEELKKEKEEVCIFLASPFDWLKRLNGPWERKANVCLPVHRIQLMLIEQKINCRSRIRSKRKSTYYKAIFSKYHKKPAEQINFRENLRQVKTDKWNLDALKIDKKE